MLWLALLLFPMLYAFLVVFGALSDLSTFKIPNWVSYGLVLLFLPYAVVTWLATPYMPSLTPGFSLPPIVINFAIGFAVLVVAVIFWQRGLIGGGDAKYLAATSLWMGPVGSIQFMLLLSVLALVMGLVLKVTSKWGFLVHGGRLPGLVKRLYAKIEDNQLPYGFPIGIAALIMIPRIFSH